MKIFHFVPLHIEQLFEKVDAQNIYKGNIFIKKTAMLFIIVTSFISYFQEQWICIKTKYTFEKKT